MIEIILTPEMLTLFGILFGLIFVAPLICSVITEYCRPSDPFDSGEDK